MGGGTDTLSGMKPTKKGKVICIPEIGNTRREVNFECCLFKDNYFRGIHKKYQNYPK